MALEGVLQASNEVECGFTVKGLGRLFERHWSEDSTVAPAHGFLSRQNSDPVEATSGTWSHLEGQPDWAAECRDLAPTASQSGVHRNAALSDCKTGRICDCEAMGYAEGGAYQSLDVDFFEQRGGCVDTAKIPIGALLRNIPKMPVYRIGGRISDVEGLDDMHVESEWDSLDMRGRCIGQVHDGNRKPGVQAVEEQAKTTLQRTRSGRVCEFDNASSTPADSESDIFECRRSNVSTATFPRVVVGGLPFAYGESGRICDAADISICEKADSELYDWRGRCVAAGDSASSTQQKTQVQMACSKTQSGRICDLLCAGSNVENGELDPFEGCGARVANALVPEIASGGHQIGYCRSGRICDADFDSHGEAENSFYDWRGRCTARGDSGSSFLQKPQAQNPYHEMRSGCICDLTSVSISADNGEMDLLDGRGCCTSEAAVSEVACNGCQLAYCKSGRICDGDVHEENGEVGADPYDQRGHCTSEWDMASGTKQMIQTQKGSGRICDLADMSKTTEDGGNDLFEGRVACMAAAAVPNKVANTSHQFAYCKSGRICDIGDLGHHGQADPCVYESRGQSKTAHEMQNGRAPQNSATSGRICELDGTSDTDEFDLYEGRQYSTPKAAASEGSKKRPEMPYCASGRMCDLECTEGLRSNL